jgi:hypothetical protein
MKMCAHASPQGGREQTESAAGIRSISTDGGPICAELLSMRPIQGYRNTTPSPLTYSAASFQVSR